MSFYEDAWSPCYAAQWCSGAPARKPTKSMICWLADRSVPLQRPPCRSPKIRSLSWTCPHATFWVVRQLLRPSEDEPAWRATADAGMGPDTVSAATTDTEAPLSLVPEPSAIVLATLALLYFLVFLPPPGSSLGSTDLSDLWLRDPVAERLGVWETRRLRGPCAHGGFGVFLRFRSPCAYGSVRSAGLVASRTAPAGLPTTIPTAAAINSSPATTSSTRA